MSEDIQNKIDEAKAEHEKILKQLGVINRAKQDAEIHLIRLVSRVETLSELLLKEKKDDDGHDRWKAQRENIA